ncbi:MAG: hypothetical protein CHACPFDD_02140 [Phycisphaerae bacterium]|nr:hypothetical protein [Phycisphaerae bacterium]
MTSIGIIMTVVDDASTESVPAASAWGLTIAADAPTFVSIVDCAPPGAVTRGIDDPHEFEMLGLNSH